MKQYFRVTQLVEVELDETKFTREFLKEYNESICDRGEGQEALLDHAAHLAWLHATGRENLEYYKLSPFVEGYGSASEMGIRAKTVLVDVCERDSTHVSSD